MNRHLEEPTLTPMEDMVYNRFGFTNDEIDEGVWYHTKSGKEYRILHLAYEEATQLGVVVYCEWKDWFEEPIYIWTRPWMEFFDGRFVLNKSSLDDA